VEGVHVERQVVELSVIVGNGRIGVAVEGDDGVHEVPYRPAIRVEDVGPILMYIDALHLFTIDVSSEVRTPVYDQTGLSGLPGTIGKCGTEQARAHNQVIVLLHPIVL